MKTKIILLTFLIKFSTSLFAQPMPFDADYYKDSLKVRNLNEFNKLEEYREKYKSFGYPAAISEWHSKEYPTFFADYYYHKGINLNKLNEYKDIGYFKADTWGGAYNIYGDIINKIFRPIIVIGKLTSFKRGTYYDETTYDLVRIINGRESYANFPQKIKCYSLDQGIGEEPNLDKSGKYKFVEKPKYFGKYEPTVGDKFILYLDTYKKNEISFENVINNTSENKTNENLIRKEYYKGDVFYNIEADYLDYSTSHGINNDKTKGQVILEELLGKLNVINKLKLTHSKTN